MSNFCTAIFKKFTRRRLSYAGKKLVPTVRHYPNAYDDNGDMVGIWWGFYADPKNDSWRTVRLPTSDHTNTNLAEKELNTFLCELAVKYK